MRHRTLLVAAAAAILALASVGVIHAIILNFTVDRSGSLSPTGSVTLTGTIQCNMGDTFDVSAILSQTHAGVAAFGQGSSPASINCTGFTQTWSLVVSPVVGELRRGPSSGLIQAFTSGGDSQVLNTRVHIGN
jgi:hypothetical protein